MVVLKLYLSFAFLCITEFQSDVVHGTRADIHGPSDDIFDT
jgi:hypothetical protein